MRLDKFICKSTEYSMAEAVTLIEQNNVMVNDNIVIKPTHQVHKNNIVQLDGKVLIPRSSRYYLVNKPADMICSNVDEKFPSVLNLLDVDKKAELHIAGRLDADTTGLVLVTDDGHWSFNLTSPKNKCEKMYKVILDRPISSDATQRFQEGILLQGESQLTLPAKLHIIDQYNVQLSITEGRFHQVKRMFAAIGNKVKSLHRHQIGGVTLNVDVGQWRSLTHPEVKALSTHE